MENKVLICLKYTSPIQLQIYYTARTRTEKDTNDIIYINVFIKTVLITGCTHS